MSAQSGPGEVLVRDRIDLFRPFGAFGHPVYQSAVQMRAMLRSRLGERHADYFARPLYDPNTSMIGWSAEVPGTPRPWSALSDDERAARQPAVDSIRSDLHALIARLHQSAAGPGAATAPLANPGGGASAYADLLEQAMKTPHETQFLYFVGEQPIIAFWGFEFQTMTAQALAVAPPANVDDPVRALAAQIVSPTDTAGAPAAPASVDARRDAGIAAARSGSRRWLPLLLALLALVAGLLLWWQWPERKEPAAASLDRPAPVARVPEATLPPAAEPKAPVAEPPAPALRIPDGALSRNDLSFVQGAWAFGRGRLSLYRDNPDNELASFRARFEFDASGQGRYVVDDQKDKDGRPVEGCVAPASATVAGDKLRIAVRRCETPDPRYSRNGMTMECLPQAGGPTTCYVVNNDNHRWQADLLRLR